MPAHLKTPLNRSLPALATQKAEDQIQVLGKSLPCSVTAVSGAIVTVKFEVLQNGITLPPATVPVANSFYFREPIQVGDKGFVTSSDAYLGGVSGLGGGTADLSQRANLSTLVFVPIGNKNWVAVDSRSVVITGVGNKAAIIQSGDGGIVITIDDSGVSIVFNGSAGVVNVTNGDVIADGISLKTHVHGEVQSGGDDTGPPI